jgi:hypothetical protein
MLIPALFYRREQSVGQRYSLELMAVHSAGNTYIKCDVAWSGLVEDFCSEVKRTGKCESKLILTCIEPIQYERGY